MRNRRGAIGLFGEFGVGNIGNDTSLRTTIALLDRAGLPARLVVITRQPERAMAAFGIPATATKSAAPERPEGRAGRVVRRVRDARRLITIVGRFDAIVVPGTGLLEASRSAARPSSTLNALAVLALAGFVRRVPVIWFAVGGGRYTGRRTRLAVRVAAWGARRRSYRDALTHAAVAACSTRAREDRVVCDVVFAHPVAGSQDGAELGPPTVVVSVIDLPTRSVAEGAATARRYVDEVIALCRKLREEGMRLRFVLGDEADDANTRSVLAGLDWRDGSDDDISYTPNRDFAELLDAVAGADVVVGSRFHVLIAAAMTARPVVVLSHADKDLQLMSEFGLPEYVYDGYAFDAHEVTKSILDARHDAGRIAPQLRSRCDANRVLIEDEVREVVALLRAALGGARA